MCDHGEGCLNVSGTNLEHLSAQQKRQLLAEVLQKRSSQPKDWPLSVGQERLYSLARLDPKIPLYNVAVAYRLKGPLNAGALEKAVRRIEERHEILRTAFPLSTGQPVQRIAPPQTRGDVFRQIDLQGIVSEGDRAKRAEQAIQSEITRAIDLAQDALWRLALIRLGDEEHIMVLTMHHIVTDGWSFDLFLKELGMLYGAFDRRLNSPLGELTLQYRNYAERQKASFSDAEFASQLRYWEKHLCGSIPPLMLPTDRPRLLEGSRSAASFHFALSAELSRALTALSQRENASLFMVMLASFAALLQRSTQQEDVLLCTPVTGRHRPQSKELIGYFNNILAIRLNLSGDPDLLELVRRTRRVSLDAYKNQDVPFQWNADLPGLRRMPLSRLLFSLDMEWPPRFELEELACEPIATDTGSADFDLSVSLWVIEGQIFGNLRFKRELFEEATIAKLSEGYQALLEMTVHEPGRKLSSLPRLMAVREPEPTPPVKAREDKKRSAGAGLPRSALQLRLVKEWEEIFEQRPIGIHDDLRLLGASSLAVANLAARIQKVFQTTLPVTAIFRAATVEKMAALLQSHDASLAQSPLAPIQPRGSMPALFLCEGVGIYYPLVPYLGADQPVYGLVTEIVSDFPNVKDLASHYLKVVLDTQPEGPYHLGGISFGGLVAFEMAQQLHAMGRKVGLLALMDTPGPDAYRLKPPLQRACGHAKNVLRFGYPYLKRKLEGRMRRKSSKPQQAESTSKSRLLGDVAQVRRLFAHSARTYKIEPYPGRIVLFMLAQRDAMSDSLYDPALGDISPTLGWGTVAAGGVEKYELTGGHVSILREPFVRTLGHQLRQCLDREQLGQ
jgi:thioesterase domain-containing protein/acyl carrier protein